MLYTFFSLDCCHRLTFTSWIFIDWDGQFQLFTVPLLLYLHFPISSNPNTSQAQHPIPTVPKTEYQVPPIHQTQSVSFTSTPTNSNFHQPKNEMSELPVLPVEDVLGFLDNPAHDKFSKKNLKKNKNVKFHVFQNLSGLHTNLFPAKLASAPTSKRSTTLQPNSAAHKRSRNLFSLCSPIARPGTAHSTCKLDYSNCDHHCRRNTDFFNASLFKLLPCNASAAKLRRFLRARF